MSTKSLERKPLLATAIILAVVLAEHVVAWLLGSEPLISRFPAADRALEEGSVEKLVNLLTEAIHQGVRKHFHAAMGSRKLDVNDVAAGREFIEDYGRVHRLR